MIIIYSITILIILLNLIYPLWLMVLSNGNSDNVIETDEINCVTLILLSYNGKQYLKKKISFLIKELSVFQNYELLIIDDDSTDGSKELLEEFRNTDNISLYLNKRNRGIPHAMNKGVAKAKYRHIIFCDQRQNLSNNIIRKIVVPLRFKNIGAVSGCISHIDKSKCFSWIRRYENFIKSKESNSGDLIGVYGPFYAIKRECYSAIPDDIVLDDLYLSIKIIQSKHIKILEDCQIIDDGFSALYDYGRAKRYVYGFLQLLKEKDFLKRLSIKQMTMLMWHKYMRLLIPVSLFLSYIATGIMGLMHIEYFITYLILTLIGIVSAIPRFKIKFRFANIVCVNIFYFMAMSEILYREILIRRKGKMFHKM